MARSRLPLISDNHLYDNGTNRLPAPIAVGSDSWYTWLSNEQHQSFSFRHHLGTFTVRRERKRQAGYWYIYHKHQGKLRKAYLGRTEEVTLERLHAVVVALVGGSSADLPVHEAKEDIAAGWIDAIAQRPLLQVEEPVPGPSAAVRNTANSIALPYHNAPVPLAPFIGREREVTAACALLQRSDIRILTFTGTGGIGKTRLSLQVAAELLTTFDDGVCFVSLASLSDPDFVIPTITQGLGLATVGGRPALENLKSSLREKELLLLLDNFEQVVAAAPFLVELLQACPLLKVLITSRTLLGIRGEHAFAVPPLRLPPLTPVAEGEPLSQFEAVAFFISRAQAVKPDFHLTAANALAIAEICVHLDGLPLAIELAATWIRLFSPQKLLSRLEHRLPMLTGGAADLPERQRTLRRTLQWSYDLLGAQEQQLFRRLAIFAGGCTPETAEELCDSLSGEGRGVIEMIALLLDSHLLYSREQGNGEMRLMMLETLREYGLERLSERRELEEAGRRHAEYYLSMAELAELKLVGAEQRVWLDMVEQEFDNLRAAAQWLLEHGERAKSLRLCSSLVRFWIVRGYLSEGRVMLEHALAGNGEVEIAVQSKALEVSAQLAIYQSDYARVMILLSEHLTLVQGAGYTPGLAFSHNILGYVMSMRGNYEAARALHEESLACYEALGDRWGIAQSLWLLGSCATSQEEYATACELNEKSLACYRALGDTWNTITLLFSLASVYLMQGNYVAVRALTQEGLKSCRELRYLRNFAYTLGLRNLGLADFFSGEYASARALLEERLLLSREIGNPQGVANALSEVGVVMYYQGEHAAARVLLEESVVRSKEAGEYVNILYTLTNLEQVVQSQGDHTRARALLEEVLEKAKISGPKWIVATCLERLGELVVQQGQPVKAVRLWGAAQALRTAIGTPISPLDQVSYEHAVAHACTLISQASFATAVAEGRGMRPEDVLASQEPAAQLTPTHAGLPESGVSTRTSPMALSSDGLTKREVEVLHLAAHGLTDGQIAETLVISPRTVHTHLTSIYSKLGITSRSAATRYAIEHHLA